MSEEMISQLTKQQQKSIDTKERIFLAAKQILKKDGYENLSIKNICKKAGVSNGSFYHHFKTKDDLLSYYIEEQPQLSPSLLHLPSGNKEAKDTIIQVYLNYAAYCKNLGVDFISNYYTPKNQALHPTTRTERTYPIVTVQNYLEKALSSGRVKLAYSIKDIATDIRMLVIGNVFEWCLHKGNTDFENNLKRSLDCYLTSIFL